jgi:hypothetical protein
MAYEFQNPRKRAIECVIRAPIGTTLIAGGTFVPTPEQEEGGLTPDLLEDWVNPSFLKRTPPALRRRLLAAKGIPIPEDLIAATAHLEEFGGVVDSVEQEKVDEILSEEPPSRKEPNTIHRHYSAEEYEKRVKKPTLTEDDGERKAPDRVEIAKKKKRLEDAAVSDQDKRGMEQLGRDMEEISTSAASSFNKRRHHKR